MKINYFIKSFFVGLTLFAVCVYVFRSDENAVIYFSVSAVNALLFPFSKRLVENIVFHCTGKDFWGSDSMTSAARGGGYTLLWMFYFVFAIPLGLFYMMGLCLKK